MEGSKIVAELIQEGTYQIDHVYALPSWLEDWTAIDAKSVHGSNTEFTHTPISPQDLKRISQLTTPNQVLAVVHLPDHSNVEMPDLSAQWSLFLDGIQSPANLGAILRVADWFGFQHVFGGPGTADLYSHKSIQATMGAFLRVSYQEATLKDILSSHSDLPVFAADLEWEDAFQFSPPKAGLLVIGNEGRGIQAATRQQVTNYLRIPHAKDRRAESLNAAVATGILCGLLKR